MKRSDLSITHLVVAGLILAIFILGGYNLILWMRGDPNAEPLLALAEITIGFLLTAWSWLRQTAPSNQQIESQAKGLPLEAVTWQQLREELVRGGQIAWVDRGDTDVNLLRTKERIAITGQRKLGKTREAIELIRRLASGRNVAVFRPNADLDQVQLAELQSLVTRQLRGFAIGILFVDDLPFWYKGVSLNRLGQLWQAFQKSSPQTYFIATVRPNQIEPEHQAWLAQHDIYTCPISRLSTEQTAEFVANALHIFNMTADEAAHNAFVNNNDGTPERPLNVLRLLDEQDATQLEAQQVQDLMQDEISVTWEANRRRIREQNALAGQLVEALALFHAARYRPHSRLLSAYVTTQGRFPRWSSSIKRAWQLLKEGYDIDGSHRFVHYPDVAVEGLFSAESAIHDIHAWAIQIPDSFWRSQALVSYGVFGLGIFLKGKHKPSTRPALALVWRRIIVWFTLDPLLPASLYKLSLAYNDLGQTKNALAVLKKAIALAPYYPLLHDGLGNAFADLGQIEDAIAAYKLAIALDPYFSSPHYNLGLLYLDLGQIEDAIAAFKQAIALDPNDASPHNNLGTAYHKLGQTKDAIAAFKQAITLDPNNASLHNNLGNAYLDLGQLEDAIAAYEQAITLDPNDASPHNNLGITFADLGQSEDAIAAYEQAITLDPNDASPHNNLGNAFVNLGQLEDAIAAFNKAIQLKPDYEFALANRGQTHWLLGNYEAALADLNQAISLNPDSSWRFYLRALIYLAIDQPSSAQQDLTQAINKAQEKHAQDPTDWLNTLNLAIYQLVATHHDEATNLYQAAISQNIPIRYIRDALQDLTEYRQFLPTDPLAQEMQERLQDHLQTRLS